jgi:hypothetical protein
MELVKHYKDEQRWRMSENFGREERGSDGLEKIT